MTAVDLRESLTRAVREQAPSAHTFEDGNSRFRIEIPSVESPEAFRAALDQAQIEGISINRISEGSGISMLKDDEILEYAQLGNEAGVEVCLFVGPRAPWNANATAMLGDGGNVGWRHTSVGDLFHAYDDVVRAVELGIRSFLIADEGLLSVLGTARADGDLPADMVLKASALMGIANPINARLLEKLGANSINVLSDTSLGELAAFRTMLGSPIDLYIESPDNLGGFMRYHDLPSIVRIASPVFLKFGLRNAPGLYPTGLHLKPLEVNSTRERVRRAAIGVERLSKASPLPGQSRTTAATRGVPQPTNR